MILVTEVLPVAVHSFVSHHTLLQLVADVLKARLLILNLSDFRWEITIHKEFHIRRTPQSSATVHVPVSQKAQLEGQP